MQLSDMLSLRDFTGRETRRISVASHREEMDPDVVKFLDWIEKLWPEFTKKFDRNGYMDFEEFEQYVRWEGGYLCDVANLFNALKIADGKDVPDEDIGTGPIHVRTMIDLRNRYGRSRDVLYCGLDGLQRLMLGKYGSLSRAWRQVFDREDKGKCCYTAWVRGCELNGFKGDSKKAWLQVTNKEPNKSITLRDWDPETDCLLSAFCKLLTQRYGSIRHGWREMLRQTKSCNGRIGGREWIEVCSHVGFNKKDAQLLFKCLDTDGSRTIDIQEFGFIENWHVTDKTGEGRKKKERQVLSFRERDLEKYSPEKVGAKAKANKNSSSWYSAPPEDGGFARSLSGTGGEEVVAKNLDGAAVQGEPASFEFVVELTRAEYEDYLRRRREAQVATSLKPKSEDQQFPDRLQFRVPSEGGGSVVSRSPAISSSQNGSRRPSVLSHQSLSSDVHGSGYKA